MVNNQFKSNSLKTNYLPLMNEINEFESNLKMLNDRELRIQNFNLKKKYSTTQNLNALIAESFALTREASRRTLGLRHFDTQLLGGLILNNNKIAEMKTGEGKTVVATLPVVLNALTKKGVHVITVNDYLANRDQVSMGQIYRFLGLDTGLIQEDMRTNDRKENYKSDITYVTNSELAFDYLRDHIATNLSDIVLRPFNFCIIDEVDSILIDEAQTPLILSDKDQKTFQKRLHNKFITASEISKYLQLNKHFQVDEKNKNVILTSKGNKRVESILEIPDLYNRKNPWISYIINALTAKSLFFKNTHYIIENNRVVIIDEFTGRAMPDRRWGEGLHQAIEAKEKLRISPKSEIKAAITYQNFFLMYPKLSGMTGTGKTAEIEFEKIYNLPVETLPTINPSQRKDLPDLIYKDQFSKWNAVAQFCNQKSLIGQPILIGTITIEKSEMLAELLTEYKLSYQLLNAKPENARRESEIVAQAGKKNSLTIATNMAGRGTDIILGGNLNFKIQKELYTLLALTRNYKYSKTGKFFDFNLLNKSKKITPKFLSVLLSLVNDNQFLILSDIEILRILQENDRISIPTTFYQCSIRFLINELVTFNKRYQKIETKIVKNLGGLYVIGTERNDSARIDNQLRGRSARQGDPGTTRFFLSLDDKLLRLFGGTEVQKFSQNQTLDNSPIESAFINPTLDSAQEKVEERAYEQRKNLFNYDDLLNKQRQILYIERRNLVENKTSFRKNIFSYGEQIVCECISQLEDKEVDILEIIELFENLFGNNLELNLFKNKLFEISNFNFIELKRYLVNEFWLIYQLKVNEISIYGNEIFDNIERRSTLITIDRIWQIHLEKMTLLRDSVGWRGYGQKNPLTEYKRDSYNLFAQGQVKLVSLIVYDLLRSTII